MRKSTLVLIVLFLISGLSFGLNKGKIGLNMRVDPSPRVGMTFHFASKLALRPYIGFSQRETEADTEFRLRPEAPLRTGTRKEESTDLSFGLSLLYFLHQHRDFSIYTGPSFGYTNENTDVRLSWREEDAEISRNFYSLSFLLGTQYDLSDNFSLFGEIGFGYSTSDTESDNNLETSINSKRWGLINTGVGIIFYF